MEAEYQEVLQIAEDNWQYWEEHNCEHFARLAAMSPKPGQKKLCALNFKLGKTDLSSQYEFPDRS